MIDIARNIVPCSDKQDMKSRNGSYFQPSFSTRKRQRISSDLFSELPQKRSKTTNGRIWNKATYSFSSQILCTISSKVIRMWASFLIFVYLLYAAFRRNGHSRFTGCPESRRAAVNVIHSPCPHSAATASPILLFRICKNGSDAVISTISTGKTKPTGRWRRSRSGQSSPWSNSRS